MKRSTSRAKKHNSPKVNSILKCKLCYGEFPGFYAIRQHENTHNGFPNGTKNIDLDVVIIEVDDAHLKEGLRSFQDVLVDSEPQKARHKELICAVKNLNASMVQEKLYRFFDILKCVAKEHRGIDFSEQNS